jgi:hypothetical protein
MKNGNVAKSGRKVKAIALLFCCFLSIYKKWKTVDKNGRKIKGIGLLFCCFLPIDEKWKTSLKVDEK